MNNVFLFFVRGLPVTCVIIVAAFVLRFLLRKQSKRLVNVIWVFLLFRLLCPIVVEGELGIVSEGMLLFAGALTGAGEYGIENEMDMQEADIYQEHTERNTTRENLAAILNQFVADNPGEGMNLTVNAGQWGENNQSDEKADVGEMIQNTELLYINNQFWIEQFLMRIWWTGIICMLGYNVFSMICLQKKQKSAVPMPGAANVYLWQDDTAPCVIGILRPCIYVPAYLTEEAMDIVIRHETVHIRRKDHLLMLLYYLALCIHWYNPLFWLL